MRFGRYFITVRAEDDILLPGYLGSTLRGGFGTALKTSMCGNLSRDCGSCGIAKRCLYAKTFEPKFLSDGINLRGMEPPPAYVLEPPSEHLSRLGRGESLSFNLLLFGEANSCLPFFLNAFEMMGRRGIGRRGNGPGGGRFALQEVGQKPGVNLFDPETGRLTTEPVADHIRLREAPSDAFLTLTAALRTPLRLKFHSQLQDTLPFHVLVRAALRRVSAVFAVHGNGEPDLEYARLTAEAAQVRTLSCKLRWLDWERYSNRQKRRMMLGGMVGTVRYAGVPGEYLPVLEMAGLMHLGKQSTFGLGKLEMLWRPEPVDGLRITGKADDEED